MQQDRLNYLLEKYRSGELHEEERQELLQQLKVEDVENLLPSLLSKPGQEKDSLHHDEMKKVFAQVVNIDKDNGMAHQPVRRFRLVRTTWLRYAAAVLIVISIATYYLGFYQKTGSSPVTVTDNTVNDVQPGGEKAFLTLADGQVITLDNAENGRVAIQGGVNVVKMANGEILYDQLTKEPDEVLWNTMTTPKGGQYQLTLPDGTRAWLNASSSISFPVAFTGNQRAVKIRGEIYLEVARDKEKPFRVELEGNTNIEVLGTIFNVNSYTNEETITTTLLEGKVAVNKGEQNLVLRPGQQAATSISLPSAPIELVKNANIEQALAWKNGLFDFTNADLKTAMRQLERWYEIEVRYEGAIPDVQFMGKMNRGVKLSTVLQWLSEQGIRTRLQGKSLLVLTP
jgi:transmembrane sensor